MIVGVIVVVVILLRRNFPARRQKLTYVQTANKRHIFDVQPTHEDYKFLGFNLRFELLLGILNVFRLAVEPDEKEETGSTAVFTR